MESKAGYKEDKGLDKPLFCTVNLLRAEYRKTDRDCVCVSVERLEERSDSTRNVTSILKISQNSEWKKKNKGTAGSECLHCPPATQRAILCASSCLFNFLTTSLYMYSNCICVCVCVHCKTVHVLYYTEANASRWTERESLFCKLCVASS